MPGVLGVAFGACWLCLSDVPCRHGHCWQQAAWGGWRSLGAEVERQAVRFLGSVAAVALRRLARATLTGNIRPGLHPDGGLSVHPGPGLAPLLAVVPGFTLLSGFCCERSSKGRIDAARALDGWVQRWGGQVGSKEMRGSRGETTLEAQSFPAGMMVHLIGPRLHHVRNASQGDIGCRGEQSRRATLEARNPTSWRAVDITTRCDALWCQLV